MDGAGEFHPPLQHLCGTTCFACLILIFEKGGKFVIDIFKWIGGEQKHIEWKPHTWQIKRPFLKCSRTITFTIVPKHNNDAELSRDVFMYK